MVVTPHHTRRRRRRRTVALLAGSVLTSGALVIGAVQFLAPPRTPPEYAGERPAPATSGYVSHRASVFVAVPPAELTAWANGRDLGDIVEAPEGMPAVVSTQPLRGDWDPTSDRSGDRRRVQFADGHYLAEEVLVDTPERFQYQIWGFTGPHRAAVRYAVAEFSYTGRAGGTELSWTYSFMPTSELARPLVGGFVDGTIATMMSRTLEGIRSGAERDLPH